MLFNFTKMHGLGNDMILIDDREEKIRNINEFARRILHRNTGVGADNLLIVRKPSLPGADVRMLILNNDGSEAEMCGNGIRCFSRYVYEYGLTDGQTEFPVETGAGVLVPRMEITDGKVTGVRVDMGEPILAGDEIPVTGFGQKRVVNEPLDVDGKTWRMTCVSMGNPHCVIFVDDAEKFPIYELGTHFEHSPRFPRKTNTEFVEVRDRSHVRMRVWERGAAVTLACGTGSCATVVAGVLNDKIDRKAEVTLDGGKLVVEWAENNHVFMAGPAECVFTGEWAE